MNVTELLSLGFNHARNAVAESIYLNNGPDLTKPITFYALVDEKCNCKCRHCEYWRMAEYVPEMNLEQWKKTLLSIKEFRGSFSLNFSGGEPFLQKWFIDLLMFCRDNDIHAGVTTNGSLLNEKNVPRIVEAKPFNVNISCDSHIGEVHDYIRGMNGLFRKINRGIELLHQEQARQKITFPVIIKPTIMSPNFRMLPDTVKWAMDVGATAVNFQPLGRWTQETYDELWIEEKDWPELESIMQQLIAMKRAGAPIMNSEEVLGLVTANFREEKAPPENMPCRIGLQEFFIRPDGNVKLCFHFPDIGNTTRQSAREIWTGPEAKKIRAATIQCDRLCLLTCLSHKSIRNKFNQAMTILARQKKTNHV